MDGRTTEGFAAMRYLIADDDRDSAYLVGEILRLARRPPVELTLVYDGQAALTAATRADAGTDAIIMDVDMPGLDGIGAATGIAAALGKKTPVLVAITGNTHPARLAAAAAAFDHVLIKPIDFDGLLALLP